MKYSFTSSLTVVAGACLALMAVTTEAVKIDHPKFDASYNDVIPGRYIVSFNPKKGSSSGGISTQSVNDFKSADVTVKDSFNHDLFSGVSVEIDASDDKIHSSALKNILDREDVRSVIPVRLVKRPKVKLEKKKKGKTPSILPHSMTQVDQVHSELKNKGKGVFVGVIDSGVDYKHPALGGGFGKGFKVVKGYDLVGDAYTGKNAPKPDSDPLDECGAESGASGHGTHVSGIIAGYDKETNFVGVAPEATLGMWRVFGCDGEATNDVIIKALLMAYDAGCDVINLSLGETNSWGTSADDAETSVVNQIVAKGVSVVISAGNSGANGIYTVGQPSTSKNAFSVASIENEYYVAKEFSATGISKPILYSPSGKDTIVDGQVVLSDKTVGNTADSCTPGQVSTNVKGKIALIQRGTCAFADKANNAAAAGAVAVIIFNNAPGALTASVPGVTIPVISITNEDGKALSAAIQKGTVTLKFNHAGSLNPIPNGGTVSTFSSLGAESALDFKPNVAGVGGNVYSTLPRYLDSWGIMSGTSMAAPYVAGSVALYLHSQGNNKKQSVPFINSHFQNYALPVSVYNSSNIDTPVRQGAGLVQVYDTIVQKSHVYPSQISFNDTATTKYRKQTITITNRGKKTIAYEVKNDVATGVSPYDVKVSGYTPLEPAVNSVAKASLRFSTKSFKLAPGKSKKITVTVTPPKTNPRDHVFYGGYIHVVNKQKTNGARDLRVPYFGVVGSQKTLPIFDEGFPTIIDQKSNEYTPKDTFTFDRSSRANAPIAVLRILTPTANIKAELIDAKTKKSIGQFLTGLKFVGRNFLTGDGRYTQKLWDGTYLPNGIENALPVAAPEGTYLWKFSALKLLGDPKNKKDWEVYTSGPIVVKN